MKAKSFIFAAAALVMAAACNPDQKPEDVFDVKFDVSNKAIEVPAEGKSVSFSVTSNVAWSVSCDADWLTVDPASVANDTKEEVTTKVTIKVSANESEESGRETVVNFGADDTNVIAVTVKQAKKEHVYKTITVFDVDKFEAVENYSAEAEGMGSTISFVVSADGDWTAEASEWITVTPASNKYDGENDLVTVTAVVAVNTTGAAREGSITFKGDFEKELVVPVAQKKAEEATISVHDVTYRNAFYDVTINENIYWSLVYADDEIFGSYGVDGLADYLCSRAQSFVTNYASSYTADELFEMLYEKGSVKDAELDELDGETKYHVVVVGLACEDGKTVTLATMPGYATFTTEKTPVADPAYAALIGTYSNEAALDYFATQTNKKNTFVPLVMTVEALDINETVKISFPGDTYFPAGSNGNCDWFLGTVVNGEIVVNNGILSGLGFNWNYGTLGTCGIALDAFYYASETVEFDTFKFTPSEAGFVMVADTPSDVEGDYICIEALIISSDGESTGYANGMAVLIEPNFTKSTAAAAASVKGIKTTEKSISSAKKALKK